MRVLVLNNQRSGTGDAGLYDLVDNLGRRGCEVTLRFLDRDGCVERLLEDADRFDRVVAAGGDGTVSSVCYELRESGIPVLPYPAGTANLLASNLRMPLDPRRLADLTLEGDRIAVDLGEITHLASTDSLPPRQRCGFIVAAGAGFDAAIMEAAQPLKGGLGALAYLVGVLQNLAPTVARFDVIIDGETVTTEGIAVLVVNFARIQFDIPMTHGSDPRDGVFEVALVRTRTAVGLLPTVWAAMLDRVLEYPDRGKLDVRTAREVLVSSDPPLKLQYDGEVVESTTPFGTRVLPGAATLIVPASSPHIGPEDSVGGSAEEEPR